jgi:hypothetical protein
MKTRWLVPGLAAAPTLFAASEARAFGSATLVSIGERVFPQCAWSADFACGSIATDIEPYVADPGLPRAGLRGA